MTRVVGSVVTGDPAKHWLAKFANLNAEPDRGRGVAPHKPLLLFCVLDMLDTGLLADGRLEMSAELVFRFETYWSFVLERRHRKGDIRLPFHALGSIYDRVWQRFTDDGRLSPGRDSTRVCLIDASLLPLLKSATFRKKVRQVLLSGRYFTPSERVGLATAMKLPPPDEADVVKLQEDAATYEASQRKGRNQRFKVEVLTRYGFTCALTGYRLTTERGNLVEAAHIHQRADSLNDDPQNGLALTPDSHWMFDAGMWSVNEHRRVVVASERAFTEWCLPGGFRLRELAGRELFFKDGCGFRPDWRLFEWHRRQRFWDQARQF